MDNLGAKPKLLQPDRWRVLEPQKNEETKLMASANTLRIFIIDVARTFSRWFKRMEHGIRKSREPADKNIRTTSHLETLQGSERRHSAGFAQEAIRNV